MTWILIETGFGLEFGLISFRLGLNWIWIEFGFGFGLDLDWIWLWIGFGLDLNLFHLGWDWI